MLVRHTPIEEFIDTGALRAQQWRSRLHIQLKPVLQDFSMDLVQRITKFASKRLPQMYSTSEYPDFDLHPGLLVSYTLIIRVIEPLLAELLHGLDEQLKHLPVGEQFEIDPWIEDQVKPALRELLVKLQYPRSDVPGSRYPGALFCVIRSDC